MSERSYHGATFSYWTPKIWVLFWSTRKRHTRKIQRLEGLEEGRKYSFRLGLFYMHHPTDRITPVVEHWLEREIAQWVHYERSIRRPIALWANALTSRSHETDRVNGFGSWWNTRKIQRWEGPSEWIWQLANIIWGKLRDTINGGNNGFDSSTTSLKGVQTLWWRGKTMIHHWSRPNISWP